MAIMNMGAGGDETKTLIEVAEGTVSGNLTLTELSSIAGGSQAGRNIFARCSNLEGIYLPNLEGTMPEFSVFFAGDNNLKVVYMPKASFAIRKLGMPSAIESITYLKGGIISVSAFVGKNIKYIHQMYSGGSASSTDLSSCAFQGCTALYHAYLPAISVIPSAAFQGCTALRTFSIWKNISSISAYAFSGCSSLESIYIEGLYGGSRAPYFQVNSSSTVFADTPILDSSYLGHFGSIYFSDQATYDVYARATYWSTLTDRFVLL